MTNPFDAIKDKIDALIAKGLKSLHIRILREETDSLLSRLATLDTDRGQIYLKMIAYMEGDGSGSVGLLDAAPTTAPPQRPPDTGP